MHEYSNKREHTPNTIRDDIASPRPLTLPLKAAGTRLLAVSIHRAGDPAAAAAERLPLLAAAATAAPVVSSALCSAGEKKASSSATDVSFGVRSGNRPSL